jgi:hypothetical protein
MKLKLALCALLLGIAVFTSAQAVPVAVPDAYSIAPNATLNVVAPGVMGNDVFQPGTQALLIKTPLHGTLTLAVTGAINYVPASGFVGEDAFTYVLEDSEGNRSAETIDTIAVGGLNSVGLGAASVVGGTTGFGGDVYLNFRTAAAINVALTSSNNAVMSVPVTVPVAANQTAGAFTVVTASVRANTLCTLTATYLGYSVTATLNVLAASVRLVSVSPNEATGGSSTVVTGTVTLNGPAPTGGVVVDLTCSDPLLVKVPSSITVASGAATGTFSVGHIQVDSTVSVRIYGTSGGGTSYAILTLTPYTVLLSVKGTTNLGSKYLSPAIIGGTDPQGKFNTATCTVTISAPAPASGLLVNISSYSQIGGFGIPSTVTVPSGKTTATFLAHEVYYTAAEIQLTLYAYYGESVSLVTVYDYPVALSLIAPNDFYQFGGNSFPVTASLLGFAPPGGAVIPLKSNTTSVTIPASVTISAGASSAIFNVASKAVPGTTLVNITGTYQGNSLTCPFDLLAAQVANIVLGSNLIVGGSSTTGTVTLNGLAGASGAAVTLSATPTGIITPTSVAVKAGARSAAFTLSSVSVKTTTQVVIHAYTWAGGSQWWTTTIVTVTPNGAYQKVTANHP